MANVWQFSPSSLPLLESCVKAAAASNKPSQKWMQLFKPTETKEDAVKQENNSLSTVAYGSDNDSIATETMEIDNREDTTENVNKIDLQQAERVRRTLELDSTNKMEYLKEHCINDYLLPFLADALTIPCIQKICTYLFNNQTIDETLVDKIFQQFLPIYLKRECSLELLVQAYKTYPEQLRTLMSILLSDANMPTKTLEQFFFTVKDNERSDFLQHLSKTELGSEAFIHHLSTISCLYKSSDKSSEIQRFILNCLQTSSEACKEDKNYGKFMLMFFQSLNGTHYQITKSALERLLNSHGTSFKIPCIKILSSLNF